MHQAAGCEEPPCRGTSGTIGAESSLRFSAEMPWLFGQADANHTTSCGNPRCSFGYAFSPTGNFANSNGTLAGDN